MTTEINLSFENLDGTDNLDDNMTQFWALCGKNRIEGVTSILKSEKVQFRNVRATYNEAEDFQKDIKTMKKELPRMLVEIPIEDNMKGFLETKFTAEIVKSTSIQEVAQFFFLVNEVKYANTEDNNEYNCDESSEDDSM